MTIERRDVLKKLGIAGTAVATGSSIATAERTDDDEDDSSPRIRVVHASPDAPDVDVFVDGDEVLSGVSFNTASRYLDVEAGARTVKITAADDPDTVPFEGPVTVASDTDYTLAAIGELAEDTFEVLTLVDSVELDIGDYSIVRVVHASPDAPAVDVTFKGGYNDFTPFHDVEFGQHTRFDFITTNVDEVVVTADGDEVLSDSLSIESDTTYTAYVTGYASPDDEPADAELNYLNVGESPVGGDDGDDGDDDTDDGTEKGQVRVAHASPDAPNVDVFLNDEKVLSDVPFTTVSDYLDVPAGEQTVKITAAGDPETVPFEGPVTVEANTAYTVAAVGELAEDSFAPEVLVDDFSLDDKEGAVRVLHASPDAGPVDVTAADGELTVADGLEFTSAAEYAQLDDAGHVTVEVRPDSEDNDNPFDAEFEDLDLTGVNTAIATGYFTARDEPTDEQFTLVLAADETGE